MIRKLKFGHFLSVTAVVSPTSCGTSPPIGSQVQRTVSVYYTFIKGTAMLLEQKATAELICVPHQISTLFYGAHFSFSQ